MEEIEYISERDAKNAMIEIGKRMYHKGFVAANDGNISIKCSNYRILTTPTGVSKGFMTPDMLVLTDLDGQVVGGNRKPSSELEMHLRIYRENPDLRAVVHAHPPVATTYAAAGIPLDQALVQESVVQLGIVPVASFALPGTLDVADSVAPYCHEYNGLLLAHHGAVSWGDSVLQAYFRMESIEHYATIMLYSKILGAEKFLSEAQIDALISLRPKFGIHTGGRPKGSENNFYRF